MWGDPNPDPGGQKDPTKTPSTRELLDLKDQNEQQLVLIAQLKEMLRKEQSNVTQEKVEEYVNTLSKVKAKRNSKAKRDEGSSSSTKISASIDSNKKERINLLRQQLEENKAKLAERGKSQKGIEEMVSQLQAQIKDSQQLISATPLNSSLSEQKNLEYNKNTSQEELYNILIIKEKRITELISRTQKQETTILDLQENLKEKDSVIDARTKAITLMTDSLSKKGKNTLDALEETKEQMRKMQENFVQLESEMKARQVSLLNDLKLKNMEISDLQDANNKLEEERLQLSKKLEEHLTTEKVKEEVDSTKTIINEELEELKQANELNQSRIVELENLLENKDAIIVELQKSLEATKAESLQFRDRVSVLEKELQDAKVDLQRIKNTGFATVTSEEKTKDDSQQITKLKKQLDEVNKNMIKVKAQNKSKVKELNKQLEQIKKTSDVNALVVQLQKENSKLNEKVAELEEEIGNLQLKMVESMSSSKDSSKFEDLDSRVTQLKEEIDEKDKVIAILESEVLSLKEEITQQNSKITQQVTSEMTSIHFEEQLEKIEDEKKQLIKEKEDLLHEKEELLQNIEALKKEKQELSAKLDNYIQENIELIDKLEKLSAEKVSSAESIEMVEGLTQQEKLELAAYQKTIHPEEEPLKYVEDNIPEVEPPIELNESVLQLSEDTTELLHKIEMFTSERKEVMLKMEALKEENTSLVVKLKEVENNRDILAETYEQLQNEKEELQLKLEEEVLTKEKTDESSAEDTLKELKNLQEQYEKLLHDNEELKRTLKNYDTVIHEKDDLENELRESRNKIAEFESKLTSNLEEINNYQQVIEQTKNEFIQSSVFIHQLQSKLTDRENDIHDLNAMINDLNGIIANLQNETSKLDYVEVMEKELKSVKQALDNQIEQSQEYEAEATQNTETIKSLNSDLIEMNRKLLEYENEVAVKDDEVKRLVNEIKNKDQIITNLQRAIEEKDRNFRTVSEDIKEKYLTLQKQLDGNSDSLQKKVEELSSKNKEQVEKMKKIAANLKKKTQAYHELEEQYENDKKKWELALNEQDSKVSLYEEQIETFVDKVKSLEEVVSSKATELEGTERHIQILREQLQELEHKNVDLQNYILELKSNNEKQKEVIAVQQTSLSLRDDFDKSTESTNQKKIDELNMIIETLRTELLSLKQTADVLKESKGHLEEQKSVLENKVGELEEKLKKVVANLKKKTLIHQELQKTYNEEKEKWEIEGKEKDTKSASFEEEVRLLTEKVRVLEEDNNQKRLSLEETEREINMLKDHLQSLERNNSDMQNYIAEQRRHDEQNQINLQQEMSTSLHEDFDSNKSAEFINHEKIKEQNMVIESMESDLENYKERIDKFQEGNAKLQDEKSFLENKIAELEEKLNLTSHSFKEKSMLEDQLELKLAEVSANDEALNKKLQDTVQEHQELLKKNNENEELIKKLKIKLKKSQDKVAELKSLQNNLEELENLNDELKKQVMTLEINQKHIQNENESLQKRNMSDYEKIEADYQIQLEELLKAKNDLTVECEKLADKIKELQEREEELVMEAAEYKVKLEQSEVIELEEVERLNADLKTANENLFKSKEDFDRLNQHMSELQQELLLIKTAKKAVDGIIERATEIVESPISVSTQTEDVKVHEPVVEPNTQQVIELLEQEVIHQEHQPAVPTFHWPEHENQEAFVPQTQVQSENIQQFNWAVMQTSPDPVFTETLNNAQQAENQGVEAVTVKTVNWFNMTQPSSQNSADWFNNVVSQPQENADWFNTPQQHQSETANNWFNREQTGFSNIQRAKGGEWPNPQEVSLDTESNLYNMGEPFSKRNTEPVLSPPQGPKAQSNVPVVDTGREALLNKIKALEFLLYNVDKEKEIALNECTEMFSEFTQLVYEKLNETPPEVSSNLQTQESPFTGFESQILSENDVADAASNKNELRQLEFESVKQSLGPQSQPVIENVIKPKEAYLCYNEDHRDENLQLPTIESQIQSAEDVAWAASDTKSLQQLEYAKVDPFLGEQQYPVTEVIVKPKEAYICFNEDDELVKPSTSVEPQVVSEADIAKMKDNKKELQQIEFEKVDKSLGEQKHPVVEPLAKPKQAYLCYAKDDSKQHSLEAFGENDDGWGWGPEEARLEEEHINTRQETPYMQNVQHEIEQLRENLLALQVERENHLAEIRQLQVKSGKLIKKCKELKAKNDDLSKKSASNDGGADFFDLNETIQEELKEQVGQLEKKLKELTTELEKEKIEKSSVLKKVDVLTTAHERMVEMKEIQDAEVFRWQRKHKEAAEKLQQYEWGNDGFGEGSKVPDKVEESSSLGVQKIDTAKVEELEQTVKELMLDNEELQALLDEQVKLRTDMEKSEKGISEQEYQNLQESFGRKCKEMAEKEIVLNSTTQQLQGIAHEKEILTQNNVDLRERIQEKDEIIKKMQADLMQLTHQNIEVGNQLSQDTAVESTLNSRITELEQQLSDIKQQKLEEENLLSEKDAVIDDLQTTFDQLNTKKIELEHQVKELSVLVEQHRAEVVQLLLDNENKSAEIQRLNKQVESKSEDFGALERLQEEIARLRFDAQEKDANIKTLNKSLDEIITEKNLLQTELEKLNETLLGKNKEIENILQETTVLKEEIQKLHTALQNKDLEYEEKTSALMAELAEGWQAQVDQRGADVAESWKLHLETVETEYSTVQHKLKQDITELEEKCNILVNENNELRKNVDTEIRNEIDKLSALQQQINAGQQSIAQLSNSINEKDKEINDLQNRLAQNAYLEQEIQRLSTELSEKESKLSSINIIVDTTQKQFDEKREVVEEIVRILEKNSSSPLSFEKTDVLNEFNRQLNLVEEKNIEISRLSQTIDDFHDRLNIVSEKEQEILRLNEIIAGLQSQLSLLTEKNDEISRLTEELQQTQFNIDSIQLVYSKLQQEHANCTTVLVEYQQKVLEYTAINTTMQQTIEEKNQKITNVLEQLQSIEASKSDTNKDVDKLNAEITELKQDCHVLQQGLSECQSELFRVTEQLKEKTENLESLTESLAYSQQNYELQNQELNKLKEKLQEKEREHMTAIENVQQNQLLDLQNRYEEILHVKEYDIQRIQAELHQVTEHYQQSSEKLACEVAVRQELETKIAEQSALIDEENKQLSELRLLIEDQVLKIEELKKELYEKSNQYDSLIAEMDMSRQAVTQQPSATHSQPSPFAQLPPQESVIQKAYVDEDDLSQPVNRAELDLALYMLHQRDVRCEELTVELTQLLEERDTLQLRLSNAIREKEELIHRSNSTTGILEAEGTSSALLDPDNSAEPNTPRTSRSSAIFLAASGTELASEPLEMSSHDQNLATKLSELKKVGYKKDKTFVDEQELRRYQQMSIMQQHINDASRLPPEAAAKLVDASYTLWILTGHCRLKRHLSLMDVEENPAGRGCEEDEESAYHVLAEIQNLLMGCAPARGFNLLGGHTAFIRGSGLLARDVQSPSKVLLNWLWGRSTPKVNEA